MKLAGTRQFMVFRHIHVFFCLFIAFVLLFEISSSVTAMEIPELSRERLNKIISIISRYKRDKENPRDPFVKESILKEVSEFVNLVPDAEVKTMQRDQIMNEVRRKVALRFPDSHKVFEEKVKAEAENKFRMAKINEYVSVRYQKANRVYTQEGIFYEYGYGNKSIKIGPSYISIVDLVDEDRVKFDEKFNKKMKTEYINRKIDDYYKIKQNYTSEVFNEIQRQINNENERNGYIYAYNNWRSAKDVTLALIDEISGGGAQGQSQQQQETTESETSAGKTDSNKTETTSSQASVPPVSESELEKKHRAMIKKAEDEWIKIANNFPGIDGDQGYKPARWSDSLEDVKILLAKELDNSKGTADLQYIKVPENKPITAIELHFFHGYFYKVVIRYRLASSEDLMYPIVQSIRDKYGPPDQEKDLPPEDPSAPPPEQPAEEPPPPPEETFTWTGNVTKGSLYIRRNPDGSLAQMDFTKECPKVIEEITKELEKERKRKEQEEREKELKIYKEFN